VCSRPDNGARGRQRQSRGHRSPPVHAFGRPGRTRAPDLTQRLVHASRQGLGHGPDHANDSQGGCHTTAHQGDERESLSFAPLETGNADPGKPGDGERDHKQGHARRAGRFNERDDAPPESEKRCGTPHRDQQEQDGDARNPVDLAPPFPIEGAKPRQRQDREPEVLGVQLDAVRSPVRTIETLPGEMAQEQLRHVLPREGVGGRPGEIVGHLRVARRPRDIRVEREILDCGQPHPNPHRQEGKTER